MNPFEKIFNYQISGYLDDSAVWMITSQERAWLKGMIMQPDAVHAFQPETLQKLQQLLADEEPLNLDRHVLQQAGAIDKVVVHPCLPELRTHIAHRRTLRLDYELRNGSLRVSEEAVPWRLEYSLAKKEWYLLWWQLAHNQMMRTRLGLLRKIALSTSPLDEAAFLAIGEWIEKRLLRSKRTAVVEIPNMYNTEISRILYALSSFDKKVIYDEERSTYRVILHAAHDEQEYLLSRLRFLGRRVQIIEGDYFIRRMRETASKVLARYEQTNNDD